MPAGTPAALVLAGGVAHYLTGVAAVRLALGPGLPLNRRCGMLATVPVGIRTAAGAQLAALIVVLTVMLLVDARRRGVAVSRPAAHT